MRAFGKLVLFLAVCVLIADALGGWLKKQEKPSCSTDTECMQEFGGNGGPYD